MLVSKNVYADFVKDVTVSDDMLSLLNNLSQYKNVVDTVIANNSSSYSSYYMIYTEGSTNLYRVMVFHNDVLPSATLNTNMYATWNTSFHVTIPNIANVKSLCTINLSGSFTDCRSNLGSLGYLYDDTGSYRIPLYSTFVVPIKYVQSYPLYVNFIRNGSTLTYTGNDNLPTVSDLNVIYNPPIPTDDFPLLTSFYNLCLEKFALISEEFSSNYIYIAIITIFLLITSVYFLKRRLT